MGLERFRVEDSKDYWFANDLVVYAFWVGQIIALPKIEVERGIKYLRKLKTSKTYGDAQQLYNEFQIDPLAPKLIPRIEDIKHNYEILFELWEEKEIGLHHDQNLGDRADEVPTNEELWLNVKNDQFIWDEARPYLDDSGSFSASRDAQIWTDAWVPLEIAQVAGTPDTGYGMDYYETEFIYKNRELFVGEMMKYGIEVIFGDPDLLELAGYNQEIKHE